MLLRRSVVDKDKGRKLEPRWEGPYLVHRIGKSGVSATLIHLHTDKSRGIHSFDALKIYVPREEKEDCKGVQEMIDLSWVNNGQVLDLDLTSLC